MSGNLGVRVDCMEGIQVDYMGDMDGAAMTRCGQVRNSVMDTGVAARALRMYNMRIYDVNIVIIFVFLSPRFDSDWEAHILHRDEFYSCHPGSIPTGGPKYYIVLIL